MNLLYKLKQGVFFCFWHQLEDEIKIEVLFRNLVTFKTSNYLHSYMFLTLADIGVLIWHLFVSPPLTHYCLAENVDWHLLEVMWQLRISHDDGQEPKYQVGNKPKEQIQRLHLLFVKRVCT